MPINDGGPAFPMQDQQTIHTYAAAQIVDVTDTDERDRQYVLARAAAVGGMSLRDYFAAKALSTTVGYASQDLATWGYEDFAKHAYAIADAMLAARKTTEGA